MHAPGSILCTSKKIIKRVCSVNESLAALSNLAGGFGACVGCDIVKGDHAPDGGVAQGVIHGDVIRHHGRNQEEVEEELGLEVKGQEEEDAQTPVRMTMTMDEMERHCEALSQCDSVNASNQHI